jgi:hypothetical protein
MQAGCMVFIRFEGHSVPSTCKQAVRFSSDSRATVCIPQASRLQDFHQIWGPQCAFHMQAGCKIFNSCVAQQLAGRQRARKYFSAREYSSARKHIVLSWHCRGPRLLSGWALGCGWALSCGGALSCGWALGCGWALSCDCGIELCLGCYGFWFGFQHAQFVITWASQFRGGYPWFYYWLRVGYQERGGSHTHAASVARWGMPVWAL